MKDLKIILNNFTKQDYENGVVNLHIHTKFSDGAGDYSQIIQSAKNKHYKLISITDHNSIEAYNKIQDDILLTGVEFDCWFRGVYIHLLAYGIDVNHPNLQNFYAKNKTHTEAVIQRLFTKRNVKNLIKAIHNAGGIAVLAHPACYWALNLEKMITKLLNIGLDGIEVYYPYERFRKIIKFHSTNSILKIANKYPQLIKTGGTDFHGETF